MSRFVFLPSGFDDDEWRESPEYWLSDLRARGRLRSGRKVKFCCAEILGGRKITITPTSPQRFIQPKGTNMVVILDGDGDPAEQADSLAEAVALMRKNGWCSNGPFVGRVVFWRHEKNYREYLFSAATEQLTLVPAGGVGP